MTQWRIKALIPFPMDQIAPMNPDTGGLPTNLEWESRISEYSQEFDDILICLKKIKTQENWQPSDYGNITEPAEIQITIDAPSSYEAIEKSDLLLEDICDNLAFRLQLPIPILQLEVIDVTKPLNIGDEREFLLYPFPNGYKHPKFGQTNYFNSTLTEKIPNLKVDYSNLSNRDRAVLRWYHKSLLSTSEVDRFMNLMICLEILCEQYTEHVSTTYTANCGHEISNCPKCGKSTKRKTNGLTLKKYLVEQLNMQEQIAKDTWKMRQMFHGSNDLSLNKIEKISDICKALKYSVSIGLKNRIALDKTEAPIFSIGGAGISTAMAFKGLREINGQDL